MIFDITDIVVLHIVTIMPDGMAASSHDLLRGALSNCVVHTSHQLLGNKPWRNIFNVSSRGSPVSRFPARCPGTSYEPLRRKSNFAFTCNISRMAGLKII